ncbi:unnamed protein product [Oppiella nova]|uniref:TMEM131L third Ig-like domain-containing protein n=1 Tax=Oppiella nova TaxID=334625 RepID=A0A7R9LDN8_9ACAR|nr:unnamed protein product [Oppiella nova]CAG2161950.1 unnamed protein product [Oppiella nova]
MPNKITQCSKQCTGKIVVKSKNNQYKLAIPYVVRLLQGFLSYNETQTQFYIQSNSIQEKRSLVLHNKFNSTLVIHSVSLPDEAKPYFKVVLASPAVTLAENSSETALKITFTPSSQLSHLETTFRSQIRSQQLSLPRAKATTFAVINNNPVVVKLKHWGCNMSKAYVELMGIAEGNATVISHKLDFSTLSKKQITILKPKYYAIFKLHLIGFQEEGVYYGETFVETAYERIIEGSFVLEKVVLSNCFPGRISSQTVGITSYFTHDLKYKSSIVMPEDERFSFQLNDSEQSIPLLR